jgi:hypothetical protein
VIIICSILMCEKMQSGALGCFGNGKIKTIRRRKLPLSIFTCNSLSNPSLKGC